MALIVALIISLLAPVPPVAWPLAGPPVVVRPSRHRPRPWLPGHRGVDLAGTPGASVLSAGGGVVAFAGDVAGRGVVSVDHPGGSRTTYEPVAATVVLGQALTLGAELGTLVAGHPGCPVAACLHWGLRRGEIYLNPLLLLGPLQVRLKPTRSVSAPGGGPDADTVASSRPSLGRLGVRHGPGPSPRSRTRAPGGVRRGWRATSSRSRRRRRTGPGRTAGRFPDRPTGAGTGSEW